MAVSGTAKDEFHFFWPVRINGGVGGFLYEEDCCTKVEPTELGGNVYYKGSVNM